MASRPRKNRKITCAAGIVETGLKNQSARGLNGQNITLLLLLPLTTI